MSSVDACARVPTDFKDSLSIIYNAIDEADFLAIDGEFSGKENVSRCQLNQRIAYVLIQWKCAWCFVFK